MAELVLLHNFYGKGPQEGCTPASYLWSAARSDQIALSYFQSGQPPMSCPTLWLTLQEETSPNILAKLVILAFAPCSPSLLCPYHAPWAEPVSALSVSPWQESVVSPKTSPPPAEQLLSQPGLSALVVLLASGFWGFFLHFACASLALEEHKTGQCALVWFAVFY